MPDNVRILGFHITESKLTVELERWQLNRRLMLAINQLGVNLRFEGEGKAIMHPGLPHSHVIAC